MNEWIAGLTSLPNLHPALVHFPVALLPMAVLADGLQLALRRHREWLDRSAALLYGAAALGAGAAYWAGREAADALPPLVVHIQLHVNEHSDAARLALWPIALLAVARVAVTLRDPRVRRLAARAVLLVLAAGAIVLLYRAADLGGGLVFQHGIGVAEREEHGPAQATEAAAGEARPQEAGDDDAAGRLVVAAGGELAWTPLPGDRSALESVLRPASGSDPSAVSWQPPGEAAVGLGLDVGGEALLLLPGVFGDVRVRALLDVSGFEGEVGLAHHVRSAGDAGLFTVSLPAREFALATREGGETKVLQRAAGRRGEGPLDLTVSAVGRHFNGYEADRKVVHAHEPPPPDGGCGLYVRGTGLVRVLSLAVTPGGG